MSLLDELRRRNVLRVGAAYLVMAWLVIQVAETIFPLFGFDDTPARITTILAAIGLLPSLILAWAFELTPEGIKKERDVDRSQSVTAQTGKKLDRIIMAVLAIALGYFAFDKFVLTPQREAEQVLRQDQALAKAMQRGREEGRTAAVAESYGDTSIVVLPFVNVSDDPGNEYFSDGISEELLNLLARTPELRVISRSSAFSYKGKDVKVAEIARDLNVSHVLEGSVRKAGDEVRIAVQLIDARSDTQLWSANYDRKLEDIFAIQDEIAAKVVNELKVALLAEAPRTRATSSEVYTLFMRGRALGRRSTSETRAEASALLKQALEMDPGYAPAWEQLAVTAANQGLNGDLPYADAMDQAQRFAERAVTLDPTLANAYAVLGRVVAAGQGDYPAAVKLLQRAVELAPGKAAVLGNTSAILVLMGRFEPAIELQERSVALNPLSAIANFNLADRYLAAGRAAQAEEAVRQGLLLSPNYSGGHFLLGRILLETERFPEARSAFEAERWEPMQLAGMAAASYSMAQIEESDRALQALEALADDSPGTLGFLAACAHAWREDADAAFRWLERAGEAGGPGVLSELRSEIMLRGLQDDPRWQQVLTVAGLSDAQLDAVEFSLPD